MQHDPSFLAMIRADLDDDAARVVYTDFLQSKGARYGEMLAASLALEALLPLPIAEFGAFTELRPLRPLSPDIARLKSRVRDLVSTNRTSWLGDIDVALAPREIEWRRGFIDRLAIDAERVTERVFDYAPCITGLDVSVSLGAELEPVVDSPVMDQVQRLRLGWGGATFAPRRRDVVVETANALRALALPEVWLSTRAHAMLLERPALSAIDELSLFGARGHDGVIIRAKDITDVIRASVSPAIRRLNVGHAQLGLEGLLALQKVSWWPKLEVLNLRDVNIGDREVPMILESLDASVTLAVDLSGNMLGDEAARALAGWQVGPGFRHLDLRGNIMTEGPKNELMALFGDRISV